MFLSALALAAMLQAAPDVTLKGYPRGAHAFDRTGPVSELAITPRMAKPARMRPVALPRPTFRKAVRKGLVVNPQMVNCKNSGPELVASAERLEVQPLSKMPRAHGERAVARLVDGCPVAVTIAQGPASF